MRPFLELLRDLTLAGTAAAAVVMLARLALKKAPKVFSYVLWAVVLLRLLLPAGIPVTLPALPEPETPAVQIRQEQEINIPAEPEISHEIQRPAVHTPTERKQVSVSYVLFSLWLIGFLSMVLTGLISSIRFHRKLREGILLRKNIYLVDHLGSAYVVGLIKPRIYLDSQLSREEMRYILAHERTHIRHLDHLTRKLAYLTLSIHWFNPMVWLAFYLSQKDMEMCCDESTIRYLGIHLRKEYMKSLLSLSSGKHLSPTVAFGEGSTRSRIMNLVNFRKRSKGATVRSLSLCLLTVLLCACEPSMKQDTTVPQVSEKNAETVSAIPTVNEISAESPNGEFPEFPKSQEGTGKVRLEFEGKTYAEVTDPYVIQRIEAFFQKAEAMDRTHSIGVGLNLIVEGGEEKLLRIELDPKNSFCRIGETMYDYGAGVQGPSLPQLWDLLGIDQWPHEVYEKCLSTTDPQHLPPNPEAADALLRLKAESDPSIPEKSEIDAARAAVLEGVSETDGTALCRRIREAHNEIEWMKIYDNLFSHLADPEDLAWNCLHETGGVQIGWAYEGTIDKERTMKEEGLTEDQFYEKYGERVFRYNYITAEDFAQELEQYKECVVHEGLRKDLQTMSDLIRMAAETHNVKYMVDLAHYLHDMDYFLLNYRLDKELPYIKDTSSITKYYGVLSVYLSK